MNVMRHLVLLAVPVVMVAAVACSSEPKTETATTAAPAASPAESAASMTPRVFFIEPKDGDKVKGPVKMKFGVEHYTIMPVPEGEVTTLRPSTGHYHLAFDTVCMAPGQAIPKGVNWIHYGKGDTEAEAQLAPGPHTLTLQMGDDKHVTIEGLCQTINVVAE